MKNNEAEARFYAAAEHGCFEDAAAALVLLLNKASIDVVARVLETCVVEQCTGSASLAQQVHGDMVYARREARSENLVTDLRLLTMVLRLPYILCHMELSPVAASHEALLVCTRKWLEADHPLGTDADGAVDSFRFFLAEEDAEQRAAYGREVIAFLPTIVHGGDDEEKMAFFVLCHLAFVEPTINARWAKKGVPVVAHTSVLQATFCKEKKVPTRCRKTLAAEFMREMYAAARKEEVKNAVCMLMTRPSLHATMYCAHLLAGDTPNERLPLRVDVPPEVTSFVQQHVKHNSSGKQIIKDADMERILNTPKPHQRPLRPSGWTRAMQEMTRRLAPEVAPAMAKRNTKEKKWLYALALDEA